MARSRGIVGGGEYVPALALDKGCTVGEACRADTGMTSEPPPPPKLVFSKPPAAACARAAAATAAAAAATPAADADCGGEPVRKGYPALEGSCGADSWRWARVSASEATMLPPGGKANCPPVTLGGTE